MSANDTVVLNTLDLWHITDTQELPQETVRLTPTEYATIAVLREELD